MSNITTRIRTLFATEAQMAALNPVLLEGELWTEKDEETGQSTGRRKVGDGVTSFDELPFEPSGGGEGGGAPDPHKTTHATGGTDALTPGDIGAEVAGAAAAAQSAAIAASAPAAQGVTNGNGHDHSGGDGAQIAYSSLSGLPPLGTAAAANIGTTAGTVPVLDGAGLVPSALLPGFVDDVLEFANLAAFPVTGEAGKLYISLATNRQYRWGGSVYVEINPSPGSTDGVPEGSVNLYFTSGRGESAAASWWAASSAKTKLDGIASGATNTPLSDATPQAPGTAAAGTATSAARGDHVHPLPATVTTSAAGLQPATSFAVIAYASTVTLDMAALNGQVRKVNVTGPLTLAVSNIADGQTLALRLVIDGTDRTLTVPAWSRYGYNSTTLKANKVYRLAFEIHGTSSLDQIDLAIAEKI